MRFARLGAAALATQLALAPLPGSARAVQRPTRPGQATPATPPTSTPARAQPQAAQQRGPKTEWISAPTFASRMGLSFSWIQAERSFRLKGTAGTFEFEVDSRECELKGLRVFLGEAVRIVKGQPSFSRIDEQRLLIPIVRPGAWQTQIPSLHTILIDPGHGGIDSGKINTQLALQEKHLVLDTALRLKKLLERAGYRVLLTRTDDRSLELADRAQMASRANSDLLISLHFNSVEEGADKVTGVEVFTMTPQHQLSTDQKLDPQYAPVFHPGNAQDHWNVVLGAAVHHNLLTDLKVPDRGLKRGRLAVLRLATCPAILVEGGYLSNNAESAKLASASYRERIAAAVAAGIRDYSIALDAARRSRR